MFNTKKFIENLSSDDLAIVDECQRLSLEDMKMIVEKSKCAVFFGDEKQAWSEIQQTLIQKLFAMNSKNQVLILAARSSQNRKDIVTKPTKQSRVFYFRQNKLML